MRNAMSSEFYSTPTLPNPLVCPLIDETRQTLRGYGLYKVDLNAFGCWAPGGLERGKKTLPFPDLLREAAVDATFSYATTTHKHAQKKNQQCIIQKFGPAQMSKGETSICCCLHRRGTDRETESHLGQVFSRSACRYVAAKPSAEFCCTEAISLYFMRRCSPKMGWLLHVQVAKDDRQGCV